MTTFDMLYLYMHCPYGQGLLIVAVTEVACVETSLLAADSVKVMAVLMVVGVMDDARADILGDGNIALSPIESASQVGCSTFTCKPFLVCLHDTDLPTLMNRMHNYTLFICKGHAAVCCRRCTASFYPSF